MRTHRSSAHPGCHRPRWRTICARYSLTRRHHLTLSPPYRSLGLRKSTLRRLQRVYRNSGGLRPVGCARYPPRWSSTWRGRPSHRLHDFLIYVWRAVPPPGHGGTSNWYPSLNKRGTGGTPTIIGGLRLATHWPNWPWVSSTRGCRLWLMMPTLGPLNRQGLGLATLWRTWPWYSKWPYSRPTSTITA